MTMTTDPAADNADTTTLQEDTTLATNDDEPEYKVNKSRLPTAPTKN